MADLSSITSSTSAFFAKQAADLGKATDAATKSFASTLSGVQSAIAGKPTTGFTSGPTYEANTLTGQTKAAFNNTLSTAKSVLNIKP